MQKGAIAPILTALAVAAGACSSTGLSYSSSTKVPPSVTSSPAASPQSVSSDGTRASVAAEATHFPTLAVGADLPSDATCGREVRPAKEVRPANAVANATRGVGGNAEFPRVTGNYVGTTDEIIQWAACKWGIDEDVVRAQAAVETYWLQHNTGDFATDSSTCVPGHQTLGADGQAGRCPQSIGILQDRFPYHPSAFATHDNAAVSTAYNIDYAYAVWRNCFEGNDEWFNQFNPPKPYKAGDLWGCVGAWYSGRWYDPGAVSYISKVQDYLARRIWDTAGFLSYS